MTLEEAKERLFKNWWVVIKGGNMPKTRAYFIKHLGISNDGFSAFVKEIGVRKMMGK